MSCVFHCADTCTEGTKAMAGGAAGSSTRSGQRRQTEGRTIFTSVDSQLEMMKI